MNEDKCPLLYTDDIETIPVDEADDIASVVQAMHLLLARHNHVRRSAYPVSSAWRRQQTEVKSEMSPSG